MLEDARSYTPEEVFGPREPGRLIRGARAREGVTRVELARRLGVSRSYLSDLEYGRRAVSKKMAQTIGRELEVNWRVLL